MTIPINPSDVDNGGPEVTPSPSAVLAPPLPLLDPVSPGEFLLVHELKDGRSLLSGHGALWVATRLDV